MAKKKKPARKRKPKATPKRATKKRLATARKSKQRPVRAKAKSAPKRKRAKRRRLRGAASSLDVAPFEVRGLGAASGGQSGDTQGLSGIATTNSESVEELLEEGQSYEAEVISGVEGARDPDDGEVETRQVPEDDVPGEYRDDQ